MANRFAQKFQWGKETVNGTAVAADTMLLADPKPLRPDRSPTLIRHAIGVRSNADSVETYQYLVRDSLRLGHAYFQILPMLLSCGLKGTITPTETTGGQADYLWTHTPAVTGSNALDSITLEEGDDTQAYETEYVMFERLRISGQIAQDQGESPVVIEADYFGRQHTGTSFTGSLSLPSVNFMNAKLARFYLDTAWAGVGGTEKTGILRAFDIEILTGVHPKFLGSAAQYFTSHGQGDIEVMAAFTFERGAASDAIWDAMQAKSLQVARLTITGPVIGTGTAHKLTLDIGGIWQDVIPMNQEDRGNNIDTALLHSKYDATGAKALAVTVTTNVAAI